MRIEHARAMKGSKARLVGALMGLALVAGTLPATGDAPTKHATFLEAARPAAAGLASTTPDRISLREAIADRDTLDLQLD